MSAGMSRTCALTLAFFAAGQSIVSAWPLDGTALCTASNDQVLGGIVSDFQGGAITAWKDYRNPSDPAVYARRCDALGTALWAADGIRLGSTTNTSFQQGPVMTPDISGGAIVAWNGNPAVSFPGLYVQRVDGQGTLLWGSAGLALSTDSFSNFPAAILNDGSSGVITPPAYYVAWVRDQRPSSSACDIEIQRVDVNGAGLWTPTFGGGVWLHTANASFSVPQVAMASDGVGFHLLPRGAVVAWADDTEHRVWAQRVNPDGAPQWASGGVRICPLSSTQMSPAIANVGVGQLILAWCDLRNGQGDIYMQKIDSAGNPQWLANGIPICVDGSLQNYPRVLSDGAGGAFLVWNDLRGNQGRFFAQHVDAAGNALWAANGIPFALHTEAESVPAVTSDGAGGLLTCWEFNIDIYAQRMDPNGNLLWGAPGASVCRATGVQAHSLLIPNNNGAIVAWSDSRNHDTSGVDIYANAVAGDGGVSATPLVGSAAPLLSLASGNPTRGGARFQLQLPSARSVSLEIHDVAGRHVRTVASSWLGAGPHSLSWDGRDDSTTQVAPGVYFVRLTAGESSETSHVVVVR